MTHGCRATSIPGADDQLLLCLRSAADYSGLVVCIAAASLDLYVTSPFPTARATAAAAENGHCDRLAVDDDRLA
jgi:hypothetical protein